MTESKDSWVIRVLFWATVAFWLVAGWVDAGAQQAVVVPATTASAAITGTVAGATKIVSGASGKSIYVTALALVPNTGASTVTLTQGTGTNCATGTTNVTGAMAIANGQTFANGSGYGAILALVKGNDLCITIATNPAPGYIAWALF